MREVPFDDSRRAAWDAFCLAEPGAWFQHTTSWLDYCADSRRGVETQNVSSLLLGDDDEILAVVPLLLERSDGVAQLTFSGAGTPCAVFSAALGAKRRREAERHVFSGYREAGHRYGAERVSLRLLNSLQGDAGDELLLAREGYLDLTTVTAVAALQHDDETLLGRLRKDHRASIRKAAAARVEVIAYDAGRITDADFARFRAAYIHAAGGQHRPDNVFDQTLRFIRDGHAVLYEALEDGRPAAYSVALTYKDYAYYALACRDPEHNRVGSHILQWELMRDLRQRGLRWYELGQQDFAPTFAHPVDAKGSAISEYKRGFASELVRVPAGELFLSARFLRATLGARVDRYAEALGSRPWFTG